MSNKDIHKVIKSRGNLKVSGPRKLQTLFYKSQWSIVGPALCNMIKETFNNPHLVGNINDTLITLIPKVDQASSLKNFRPISLGNVAYKGITKIIA